MMGMFDEVKCDYPLPDQRVQAETFQTKSLGCDIDQYTITAQGRLVKHVWDSEDVPQAERPYPDATDWRAFVGMSRVVEGSERLLDQNYHGYLTFYTSIGEHGSTWEWIEFLAKFTDGTLVSVERVKEEAHPC